MGTKNRASVCFSLNYQHDTHISGTISVHFEVDKDYSLKATSLKAIEEMEEMLIDMRESIITGNTQIHDASIYIPDEDKRKDTINPLIYYS